MVINIIAKIRNFYLEARYGGKNEQTDSGLSLSEQVLNASFEAESAAGNRKLRHPSYYRQKLFEVKNKLKKEMKNGKTAEKSIMEYIGNLEFLDHSLPTKTLEEGLVNCTSSTALFLSLAEMLDYKLFENCSVGFVNSADGRREHIVTRKNTAEEHNIIDYDETFPDSRYLVRYGRAPAITPKKAILAPIFSLGGGLSKNGDDALRLYCKALMIYPEYINGWNNKGAAFYNLGRYDEALKCFDEALKIQPENVLIQENKETTLFWKRMTDQPQ